MPLQGKIDQMNGMEFRALGESMHAGRCKGLHANVIARTEVLASKQLYLESILGHEWWVRKTLNDLPCVQKLSAGNLT